MHLSLPLELLGIAALATLFAAWLIARGPRMVGLLIFKYLRRRRIAWVSLAAVMLCTTMVLVVISVMGGWLEMFENSSRGLSGDLIVSNHSLRGFGGYEKMIDRMEKGPTKDIVAAAVPEINAFGLIDIGDADRDMKIIGVEVIGLPIDKIGQVNHFPESLYRQSTEPAQAGHKPLTRPTFNPFDLHDRVSIPLAALPDNVKVLDLNGHFETGNAELNKKVLIDVAPDDRGRSSIVATAPLNDEDRDRLTGLSDDKFWVKSVNQLALQSRWPGMIGSTGVLEIHKGPDGSLVGRAPFKHHLRGTLTVMGFTAQGRIDANNRADRSYWIMDDSHTGMWQSDARSVYVPFDVLQQDLGMVASTATDRGTGASDRTGADERDPHQAQARG